MRRWWSSHFQLKSTCTNTHLFCSHIHQINQRARAEPWTEQEDDNVDNDGHCQLIVFFTWWSRVVCLNDNGLSSLWSCVNWLNYRLDVDWLHYWLDNHGLHHRLSVDWCRLLVDDCGLLHFLLLCKTLAELPFWEVYNMSRHGYCLVILFKKAFVFTISL